MQTASILVVDDDPSTLAALGCALDDEGYTVTTAESGKRGWQEYKSQTFDVVISDVRMRDGDGVSLLENVRAGEQAQPLFILMSGYSDISARDAKAKGADAYFHKPCWLADMLTIIEDRLEQPPN